MLSIAGDLVRPHHGPPVALSSSVEACGRVAPALVKLTSDTVSGPRATAEKGARFCGGRGRAGGF
jgi:hypothetical protein